MNRLGVRFALMWAVLAFFAALPVGAVISAGPPMIQVLLFVYLQCILVGALFFSERA